jgi:hypothetical protein
VTKYKPSTMIIATSDEILQKGLEMGGFDHQHQQNAQCKAMAQKKRNGNSKT